jgi:hypothetical protein
MKKTYLLLALLIFVISCEKEEDVPTHLEIPQEKMFDKISMDQFLSNINSNEKLESFSNLFDINISSSKTISNKNVQNNLDKAFILTDNIIKIKKEDFTTYTFTIFTQTENDEFYNLVLYANNNNIIYKSHVLKYTPSQKWLNDTEQHFSGNVELVNNNIFDVNNFLNSKSAIDNKQNSADGCIVSVTSESVCSNGVSGHSAGSPGRSGGCYANDFELILTAIYGPCTGSGGGDFDPDTDEETPTNGGGGGDDSTIVTAPNKVPYTTQFKNFESGTLNTLERNYYQSDSNIKNTIDRYLIQKNFSSISKSDTKSSLSFGKDLNLNFAQFNWAFINRNTTDFSNLENYLNREIKTPEVEDFAKSAIDAINDDGKVDYEEKIINSLKGKALCVYDKLVSSSQGFKNSIQKFDPDFPVAHLRFDMGDIGNSKGKTIAPNSNPTTANSPNYVITVRLNNNTTSNGVDKRPNLLIVKTIAHEVIHAEMFRKLLSVLDNGGNITGVTRQDVLDALDGNFPGMYDYFRRHKNWQHQQMATHYRETLARILQEYETGIAVPDNQQPSQLYMDLSWEGLIYEIGDNAIYTWTSLPENEKNRIKSVISNYIEDNSNETCTE